MFQKMKWLFLFFVGCLAFMSNDAGAVQPLNDSSRPNQINIDNQEGSCKKEHYNSVKEYMNYGIPKIESDTLDLSSLGFKSLEGLQDFPNASQVHVLNLSDNEITEIPEGIFTRFTNVHTIYLQNNKLETFKKGSFHGLQKLRNLLIFNNPLKTPTVLSEWVTSVVGENVAVFWQPYNRATGGYSIKEWIEEEGKPAITTWIGSTTTKMSELPLYGQTLLDLSEKGFTNADGLLLLENVEKVQILDLSKNNISCIPKGLLNRFINLTTLIVSHNSLRTFPWEDLKCLPFLKQVVLSHNQLIEPPKGEFSQLLSLELDHNELSSFDLEDNGKRKKWALQKVWLNENKFTTIPLGCFPSNYRQNILFDMSNNPLGAIGKKRSAASSIEYTTEIDSYDRSRLENPKNPHNDYVLCSFYPSLVRSSKMDYEYFQYSYVYNEVKITKHEEKIDTPPVVTPPANVNAIQEKSGKKKNRCSIQ